MNDPSCGGGDDCMSAVYEANMAPQQQGLATKLFLAQNLPGELGGMEFFVLGRFPRSVYSILAFCWSASNFERFGTIAVTNRCIHQVSKIGNATY